MIVFDPFRISIYVFLNSSFLIIKFECGMISIVQLLFTGQLLRVITFGSFKDISDLFNRLLWQPIFRITKKNKKYRAIALHFCKGIKIIKSKFKTLF